MKPEEFGPFLAEQRKKKDMTQGQLAKKLYVSTAAVSKWERGLCLPEVSKYEDIAQVLGLSLMEVLQCRVTDADGSECRREEVQEVLSSAIRASAEETKERKRAIKALLICLVLVALLWATLLPFYYPLSAAFRAIGLNSKGTQIESYPVDSPVSAQELLSLFQGYLDNIRTVPGEEEFPQYLSDYSPDGSLNVGIFRVQGQPLIQYSMLDSRRGIWYELSKTALSVSEFKDLQLSDMENVKAYDYDKWTRKTSWTEYRNFWVFLQDAAFKKSGLADLHRKNFPDVFCDVLESARYYLVWNSDAPDEYRLFTRTPRVSYKDSKSVTLLESYLNIMAEADCYYIGHKLNNSFPGGKPLSTKEVEQNLRDSTVPEGIRDNCRFAIFAVRGTPTEEDGKLIVEDCDYAVYAAKDFAEDHQPGEYRQENRWYIADDEGQVVVVGSGGCKGILDSWWAKQNTTAYNTPEQMVLYRADSIEIN